jgi:hypothetical protein
MIRTQIQLPDPLYREIKRIAQQQDWSIAEVIRRGAESVVRHYPPEKHTQADGFHFPPPRRGRLRVSEPEQLKELIRSDQDPTL